MQVLSILDNPKFLKTIKSANKDIPYNLKIVSPEDDLDTYFETFKPDVVIMQDQYEDVSIRFLVTMLKRIPNFIEAIKLLIASPTTNLDTVSTFIKENNMFLVDESHLESVLNTKVKALYNEKMLLEKNESHLSRRKKVLYVSDNRFMHIIVKDVCLNHSIEFQEAFDAEEALKKLKTSVPDIVLTDMDIPGLTGLELCKAIKHSEAYGHIPVIIYSSHKKTDVYEACKAAGASAYYEKNMNPKDLFAKLEAYL